MKVVESAIGFHYPQKVIPLVNGAKNKIDILMYEWKWYGHESAGGVQKLNLAVVGAARRDVKVRALLNTEHMGHAITKINSRTKSFLDRYGVKCKMGQFGGVVHAKMMLIDDNIAVVGSHNYSKAAFSRNQEVSVIINGREHILDLIDFFNDLWREYG